MLNIDNLHIWIKSDNKAVRAVDGVSFAINRGETYALLGESGCGKSVTALSIMRLLSDVPLARVSGSVSLDGVSLFDLPEKKMRNVRGRKIGMIFQEPMSALNPVKTIEDQLAEVTDDRGVMINILKEVGLSAPQRRLKQYPHEFSGGMKQRIVIAMAVAAKPDLLIADEPTTALDATTQGQVMELLRTMQRKYGMAILLITHDLGLAAGFADRMAVMYAGQLVEESGTGKVLTTPRHPYTYKLIQSLPNLAKRERELEVLSGEVPKLFQQFSGCRFAPRCPYARSSCREQAINMNADSHKVRCLFPLAGEINSSLPQRLAAKADKTKPVYAVKDLKVYFPIKKGLFRRTVGVVKAVDGISFKLYPGKTLALIGESGSGKTTVGRAMLGLEHIDGGSLEYQSRRLIKFDRATRADLQIIFQDPFSSMNPRLQVREIISEGATALGLWKKIEDDKIINILKAVGLASEHLHRYPHEFSGGQRQRIAIARALAVNPKILICDEPTSALDVSVQAQVLNLLHDLQIRQNLSYLFITHNLSAVAWIADEIAVMYLGRIVERGSPEQILNLPSHPYTKTLVESVPEDIHNRRG